MDMTQMGFLMKAALFASKAHLGQMRGETGEPYIHHLLEVAEILSNRVEDVEAVAAALLHDTLEDTAVSYRELEAVFGVRVAKLVEMVSHVSKLEDGNRAFRKHMDLIHYSLGTPSAQSIKLADLISNVSSITKTNPRFAKTFVPEAKALLEALKEGDERLRAQLSRLIEEYEREQS